MHEPEQIWYTARDGATAGPFPVDELKSQVRSGRLAPDDHVWREGMGEWVRAGDVPWLFDPNGPIAIDPDRVGYAGFWKRVVAAIIDSVIFIPIGGGLILLSIVVASVLVGSGTNQDVMDTANIIAQLASVLAFWLYQACMESSRYQATLGKLAIGIRVTDMHGRRIGFGRATGRYFATWLSMLSLYIGFLMAAFPPRKQALHDMVARTLVVNKPRR